MPLGQNEIIMVVGEAIWSDSRRASPVPNEPGFARRARTQRSPSAGPQPSATQAGCRQAVRLAIPNWRQGHPDRERLRQGCGDIGIVELIDPVDQEVTVRFDERLVKYDFGELDEIALAMRVASQYVILGFAPSFVAASHESAAYRLRDSWDIGAGERLGLRG
jgi:hypothetical protein